MAVTRQQTAGPRAPDSRGSMDRYFHADSRFCRQIFISHLSQFSSIVSGNTTQMDFEQRSEDRV